MATACTTSTTTPRTLSLELFFDTYGVQPDFERIRIYRELWDAP